MLQKRNQVILINVYANTSLNHIKRYSFLSYIVQVKSNMTVLMTILASHINTSCVFVVTVENKYECVWYLYSV